MKKFFLVLLLVLTACSLVKTAGIVGGVAGTAAAFGAPAYMIAVLAGTAAVGSDLYFEQVKTQGEKEDLQNALIDAAVGGDTGIFGGLTKFISGIVDFLFGAGIVLLLVLVALRGPRKAFGKVIRFLSGNSAPKKWATENWERLNKVEEILAKQQEHKDKNNEIS